MSDALTDMSRNERRARNIENHLEGLIVYLMGDLPAEEVKKRAKPLVKEILIKTVREKTQYPFFIFL